MEHAHEPGRRQVVQRHAPEGVLDEVRDADDTEAGRREIEQRVDRPGAHLLVGQDHDVGPLRRDDLRELLEGPQRRHSRGVSVLTDEAEHRERCVMAVPQLREHLRGAAPRPDHEHAALGDAAHDVLPGRREEEHGDRRLRQAHRPELEAHPEIEGGDRDEPHDRSRRRGDRGAEREVRAERGAQADRPDRADDARREHGPEGRERRGQEYVDRQPDQERAAAEHEPTDTVPRGGDRPRRPFEQRRCEQPLGLERRRLRADAHAVLPDGDLRKARLRPRASSGPGSVARNQACVTRRWGSNTPAAARSCRCRSCQAKLQRSPSSQR